MLQINSEVAVLQNQKIPQTKTNSIYTKVKNQLGFLIQPSTICNYNYARQVHRIYNVTVQTTTCRSAFYGLTPRKKYRVRIAALGSKQQIVYTDMVSRIAL